MSSKQAAYERDNKSLRDQISKLKADHRKAIAAKNQELKTLRDTWELLDTYPALEGFLGWLHKIRDAGAELRSSTYDVLPSPGFGDPTGNAGQTPSSDRSRLAWTNTRLEAWSLKLAERMTPRGPVSEGEIPYRPVCFNASCPAVGWAQPFSRTEEFGGPGACGTCGDPFGSHKPFTDRTRVVRCWNRGCPYYSRTGQCQHSWQKQELSDG